MRMNKMMMVLLCGMVMVGVMAASAGTVIKYEYDKQHRLTSAKYSDSKQVFYQYDAANNLDFYVAVTDTQYLESFLLWFSKTEEPHSEKDMKIYATLLDAYLFDDRI